ncbi:MAG: DMT family transporter [Alphaproteobacteria bacterium]
MAWIYLVIAGIFEIGWPLGFKLSQVYTNLRIWGIVISVICMAFSGLFLWLAQKTIPIGTAYAVWTSLGATGTFLIGIWLFGDAASLLRYFGVFLILTGVVILKLAAH